MAKKSRETKIKELNDYIWSLDGKCEKITKMNEGLILQYCRFTVITDELSVEITKKIDKLSEKDATQLIEKYEKLQKLSLNIYKTLKLDDIAGAENSKENPFLKLLRDAQSDGDF